ncbi:Calx-beta domain-containing protein [Pseudidiomarina maritima]|jgi:hypothetical protein|uniref:Calx-beta domain-containing protein n=1 Tax=Pseudidiomarina maritima TaxID=519453 RepID=A0A1I6H5E1_9GAMM|nr:Calx-beta domain-containing protein [Pseudidiomarina maritima]SFR49648.1 Calx-beta domain-containing protein [Pseudidiomarina maritima]
MAFKHRFLISSLLVLSLAACGDGEVFQNGQPPGDPTGDGGGDDGGSQTTPVASASSLTVTELTPNDAVQAEVVVTLSEASGSAASLSYATTNGTALATEHYRSTTGTLEFAAGQTSKSFSVPIISNNYYGSDKSFTVNFSGASGLELGVSAIEVTIKNNDAIPSLQFSQPQFKTSEQAGEIEVLARLSHASETPVTFAVSLAGTATRDSDYTIAEQAFSIPAFTTQVEIPLVMLSDDLKEGGETIVLGLNNADGASINSARSMLTVMISGDAVLADTGYVGYYNAGNYNAATAAAGYENQDADYGRDTGAEGTFDDDGQGNLNFTKLDFNGNALPRTATAFECVRDNLSGTVYAVWGSPTYIDGWNNPANLYRWYNSDPANNAGNAGTYSPNELEPNLDETYYTAPTCEFPGIEGGEIDYEAGCTSENYLNYLNVLGYCGFSDWRLPTVNEAQSSSLFGQLLSYDANYFPDVAQFSSTKIMTSSPAADNAGAAWCWDIQNARRMLCNKNDYISIRAARNPAVRE